MISDIHGNLPALNAVLKDAKECKVDSYIFLGDYCIGLAYPNEVADGIRASGSSYVVSGNEEEAILQHTCSSLSLRPKGQFEAGPWVNQELTESNRDYLSKLPKELKIMHPDHPPIFLFHKPQQHFSGMSPCTLNPLVFADGMEEGKFDSATFQAYSNEILEGDTKLYSAILQKEKGVYIFGHTHIPFLWEKEERLLINPGSCGLPLDFNRNAAYGILEWTGTGFKADIRRVAYDVEAAIEYTRQSSYGQEVKVWSGIITKELETAREQAVPFLHFTEQYATDRQDKLRPFCEDTWYSAYDEWSRKRWSS